MFGETISEVSAHLEDGIMTATIHTPEDTYHVEASVGYCFSFVFPYCFSLSEVGSDRRYTVYNIQMITVKKS